MSQNLQTSLSCSCYVEYHVQLTLISIDTDTVKVYEVEQLGAKFQSVKPQQLTSLQL